MPQISRARAVAYGLAILLSLGLVGRFALGGHDSAGSTRAVEGQGGAPALAAAKAPARRLYVHVVGAVVRPGLYRLPDGSRVNDAIERAGGPKPKAALELVNLASPVADGQQVIVPTRGTAAGEPAAGAVPGDAAAAPVQKVHLNSATLEQLDTLPGVGPVTAQKILDYRTEHGAFKSIRELDAVSGIGPARLAELEPLVDL